MNILIVSVTRSNKQTFEASSLLWKSLQTLRVLSAPTVEAQIHFDNVGNRSKGLGELYNEHITRENHDKIILFVHDDVEIKDASVLEKLEEALAIFDIVGLAGNTRLYADQPAWHLRPDGREGWALDDSSNLSGSVEHFGSGGSFISNYGITPKDCRLLDGLFLAINTRAVLQAGVRFNPALQFHFYDLDFCRTCYGKGLKLGTWPIAVAHAGKGTLGTPEWERDKSNYFSKWKS